MAREYRYKINTRDVDFSRRASLTTICDYLIEAASEDAKILGAGVESLAERSLAWVLMRMTVEMERYPQQMEYITISTWMESVDRLMVKRNMVIYGEDGVLIGNAITYWCIINYQTRTSQDALKLLDLSSMVDVVKSTISSPIRVRDFEAEVVGCRDVKYSHIDFNGHTNATRYISWMMDSLNYNYIKEFDPYRIDINFLQESIHNDNITISKKEDNGLLFFKLSNSSTCKILCTCKMSWINKNKKL